MRKTIAALALAVALGCASASGPGSDPTTILYNADLSYSIASDAAAAYYTMPGADPAVLTQLAVADNAAYQALAQAHAANAAGTLTAGSAAALALENALAAFQIIAAQHAPHGGK